ncbi:hypothetical protein MFLO_07632 [Listeria floridensis FSL S10-1187]|uniref:Uncharacterized protein n=2 Tax=Listeria floridensis TaxID=1494962 RepID=A0ABP3AZ77_9LIST|nr:hypothetical protein MFLO_07632 [Listeria floridensis FSL S10-1187]
MTGRTGKWMGSLLVMLAVTQFYSFFSAIYGYFMNTTDYEFIWNFWVIGILACLLLTAGLLLIRTNTFKIPALVILPLFILYLGFSVYMYQWKLMQEYEGIPFNFTNTILLILAVLVFVTLFFVKGDSEADLLNVSDKRKKKWRLSAISAALISAGLTIWAITLLINEFRHPTEESETAFRFSADFDAVFAGFSVLIFALVIFVSFRKGSYLLAGITLAIGLLFATNYLWFDQWMRYAAENSLQLGSGENRIFGINLLIAFFCFSIRYLSISREESVKACPTFLFSRIFTQYFV